MGESQKAPKHAIVLAPVLKRGHKTPSVKPKFDSTRENPPPQLVNIQKIIIEFHMPGEALLDMLLNKNRHRT